MPTPLRTSVPARPRARRLAALAAAAVASVPATLLLASPAHAHSLESSTLSVHVGEDGVDATVTVAVETLDEALGTDHLTGATTGTQDVVDYLAEHLSVTGPDGSAWAETWSGVTRETIEGIESYRVDVTFDAGTDTAGGEASAFVLDYDAVLEAVPGHEAVVVLTDAAGEVSTPGVLTASDSTLEIGSEVTATAGTGVVDMVGHGLHHVLAGADHLLFLLTLLLTAPLVVVSGRWRARTAVVPTLRAVLGVVTSFTIGHSVTLVACSLGLVSLPTRLVEVLVAASVGVAAVHAVRPLARGGERLIAGGFGLVHGLAFAGILTDLGLQGSTSLVALLAFNVGVELAQLAATAALFPAFLLLARTRWYPAFRVAGAGLALGAAAAWVLDRLGLVGNLVAPLEEAAVEHPAGVVAALAALAVLARATDRATSRSRWPGRSAGYCALEAAETR